MKLFGNIVWLLLGGFETAVEYLIAGVVLCCTLVGIPFGWQVFKMVPLLLCPFGAQPVRVKQPLGCLNVAMNVVWILVGGIWISLTHLFFGVLLCLTIVGIPFGKQHFKLMRIAFSPFGKEVVYDSR